MTRISSYDFYECDKCGQIHIKPNYGSISIYVPMDFYIEPTALKTCQKCGDKKPFSEFIYIGMKSVPPSKPQFDKQVDEFFRKLKEFVLRKNIPKEEDYRETYPKIKD